MDLLKNYKLTAADKNIKLPENIRRDRMTDIDYWKFYEILKNTNNIIENIGGFGSKDVISEYFFENKNKIKLRERILALRLFCNLTIEQAAETIGVTSLTYKKYENECFKDGLTEKQLVNLIKRSKGSIVGIKSLPDSDIDKQYEELFPQWKKYMKIYLGDPGTAIYDDDVPFYDDEWFNENGFHHLWIYFIKINNTETFKSNFQPNIDESKDIKYLKPYDSLKSMNNAVKEFNNYQNDPFEKLLNQNYFFEEIEKILLLRQREAININGLSKENKDKYNEIQNNRFEYISFLLYMSDKKIFNIASLEEWNF
tara:strand:- start:4980 stop:5915 length:936 start_codon:yes stop_codon:yes gene_type:complete